MTDTPKLTDKNGEALEIYSLRGDGPLAAFEVSYAGNQTVAAFSEYTDVVEGDKKERIFFHTQVGDQYEGRGLAAVLTTEALKRTAEEGFTVVPLCPYVNGYLQKHEAPGPVRRPERADIERVQAALRESN